MDDGQDLVAALRRPEAWPEPTAAVSVIETHISWVFLTDQFAYKVKKPVNPGFLDFSTLAARLHFCREELRLNRRTAPQLYLEVVPITGTPASPRVGGSGPAFEYAVKMRRFPGATLDVQLDRAEPLAAADLEVFGARIAAFHQAADRRDSATRGPSGCIRRRCSNNLDQTEPLLRQQEQAALAPLAAWLHEALTRLHSVLDGRAEAGMIRECHGDMHLGNLVTLDGTITAFDCIEFDPALRWIDVIDDVAFLLMDLGVRKRSDLAFAFLDAYLAATGDYAAVRLLDVYLVHRSIVRAKVAALARSELTSESAGADLADGRTAGLGERIRQYLEYAAAITRPVVPRLILMHGLPASGKSAVARELVRELPALRLSSDVERKRSAGIDRHASSDSAPGDGLYDAAHNDATYGRLAEAAKSVLRSGRHVIVDATFLNAGRRQTFHELARDVGAPFMLVDCQAPLATLEERIDQRSLTPHDSEANHAVLRYALEHSDPLEPEETAHCARVDTGVPVDCHSLATRILNFPLHPATPSGTTS